MTLALASPKGLGRVRTTHAVSLALLSMTIPNSRADDWPPMFQHSLPTLERLSTKSTGLTTWDCKGLSTVDDAVNQRSQTCWFRNVGVTKKGHLRLYVGREENRTDTEKKLLSMNLAQLFGKYDDIRVDRDVYGQANWDPYCKDDKDFLDKQGKNCESWKRRSCYQHYTNSEDDIQLVRQKCPMACHSGTCGSGVGVCLPYQRMKRNAYNLNFTEVNTSIDLNLRPFSYVDSMTNRVDFDLSVKHRPKDRTCYLTTIIYDGPPTTEFYPAHVAVLNGAFATMNLGHFLYDNILPTMAVAADWGLLTSEITWIVRDPCPYYIRSHKIAWSHCVRFYDTYRPILLNTNMLAVGDSTQSDWGVSIGQGLTEEVTLLRHVLTGVSVQGMRGAANGRSTLWQVIRDKILLGFGLDPEDSPPKKHLIVYYWKAGVRAVSNNDEIVERLKMLAPVRVIHFGRQTPNITTFEELKLLRSATLVVTPCGGISMACGFLKRISSVLFYDYVPQSISVHMDSALWEKLFMIRSFYYPVSIRERIDTGGEQYLYRLDPEHVALHAAHALQHVILA